MAESESFPASASEPFVGLRPFEEHERGIFFGRDLDIERLLNHIYSSQIVVLFGPSGTGKTSLLRAGVLPWFKQDERQGKFELFTFDDWSTPPVSQLFKRLLWHSAGRYADLRSLLDERIQKKTPRQLPIIVLDQVEEIQTNGHELEPLWDALAPVANVRNCPVRVVLSLREEFLFVLDGLIERVPDLLENRFRLGPLTEDGVRAAIREPLGRVQPAFSIEDALVDEIVRDLKESRRDRPCVEPGYLQVVCRRLWEIERKSADRTLHLATYHDNGKTTRIVEKHFRQTIDNCLSAEDQEVLFALTGYLVAPSGVKMSLSTKDFAGWVRRDDFTTNGMRLLQQDYPEIAELDRPLQAKGMLERVRRVLDRLCEKSVLILRQRRYKNRLDYELYHDLLGEVLINWRERLRERDGQRQLVQMISAKEDREKLRAFLGSTPAEQADNRPEEHLRTTKKTIEQLRFLLGKEPD